MCFKSEEKAAQFLSYISGNVIYIFDVISKQDASFPARIAAAYNQSLNFDVDKQAKKLKDKILQDDPASVLDGDTDENLNQDEEEDIKWIPVKQKSTKSNT